MIKLRRKEHERKIREEIILDVAEQVIHQKGYHGATMDEIAAKAGVGKGTLYLHFKSKKALFLAIFIRGAKILNQTMKEILLGNKTGLKMIEAIGMAYINFIIKHPVYFSAFNFYESIINKGDVLNGALAGKCEEYTREGIAYIVRGVQIGMQDGSIKTDIEPHQLSIIMWGAAKGIVYLAMHQTQNKHLKSLDNVNLDLETLFRNFTDIISSGIKNDRQSNY